MPCFRLTPALTLPALSCSNCVKIRLYSVSSVLLHTLRGVGVFVQSEGCRCMTHEGLHAFHIGTGGQGNRGTSVPLRYNNDKPEKSRIFKGFQGFKLDF